MTTTSIEANSLGGYLDGSPDADTGGHRLLAVVALRGGLGATTLALHLARASGGILVDLDRYGCGADVVAGIEGQPGLRWPDFAAASAQMESTAAVAALPTWDRVPILTRSREVGMPADLEAVGHVLAAFRRAAPVVLDLPRDVLADPAMMATLTRNATVLVVAASQVGSIAAGVGMRPILAELDAALVVRALHGGSLSPYEVARVLDLELLGVLRHDRATASATEFGIGPGGATRVRSVSDRAVRATRSGKAVHPAVVARAVLAAKLAVDVAPRGRARGGWNA